MNQYSELMVYKHDLVAHYWYIQFKWTIKLINFLCNFGNTIFIVYFLMFILIVWIIFYSRVFESISDYCETYSDLIPLSFVLGFYISIIMQRWWDQYCSIPWPDPIAVYVSSHIHGQVWTIINNDIDTYKSRYSYLRAGMLDLD